VKKKTKMRSPKIKNGNAKNVNTNGQIRKISQKDVLDVKHDLTGDLGKYTNVVIQW